jgi:hypothetical protein
VATERTDSNGVVVKAQISEWKLKQEEQALYAGAEEVPNWRLADKVRRMLADLNFHFSEQLPETVGLKIEDFDSTVARRSAVVSASAIAIRAAGSAMVLISSGYGPEAAGPLRRLIEAKLNVEAILNDPSGDYAIRYLQGRPRKLSKLAQKYGNAEEVELLSVLAHADVRGLAMLHVDQPKRSSEVIEGTFSVMPFRDVGEAEFLLHAVAYECALMCAGLAQASDVGFEIPPWVSGELGRMREKAKEDRTRREAEQAKEQPSSSRPKSKAARRSRRRAGRRRR